MSVATVLLLALVVAVGADTPCAGAPVWHGAGEENSKMAHTNSFNVVAGGVWSDTSFWQGAYNAVPDAYDNTAIGQSVYASVQVRVARKPY